ncbi:MAG: DNA alkylation repair protein [Chloroflexota bacterium]
MPAIDLARLRKQANRLADFFFLPDDFLKHLRETLDFYVNRTMRRVENIAPGSNLPTYRTPTVVMRQIENAIGPTAIENPHYALELADRLWDEGYLETRLLAAFLLGRIPPQEERLLARLTAWTQQVRDPNVRAALLTTSLSRMRKETPQAFLVLVGEWLHPARQRLWSNGLQALIPLIADPDFENLPPVFEIVQPVLEAAPGALQTDIAAVIVALYQDSPNETTFFLHEILKTTPNPLTAVTLRRILPSLPPPLQTSLRELVRPPRKE